MFSACEAGFYGAGCQQTCACPENSFCDHVTGDCICRPGHRGRHCRRGQWPRYIIICHSYCDHVTGDCICRPGHRGRHCRRGQWPRYIIYLTLLSLASGNLILSSSSLFWLNVDWSIIVTRPEISRSRTVIQGQGQCFRSQGQALQTQVINVEHCDLMSNLLAPSFVCQKLL